MAKPNLALIPATIGTKVFSVLPSDGDGDFAFTRATKATRINSLGLIEEVASTKNRLNYDLLDGKVYGCPHLLLEPARTNLETKSNGFSTWGTNSNVTKTANYIISPDGTLNGTRLQFTANGFSANTSQSLATYTISCYAKRNDSGTQNVGFFTNGSGVVNSAWAVTSEWKRFSYTFPALNGSYMGIAGSSGADISVYGFQIEGLVSYATSYIPTNGSAVTRNAETALGSGNASTFNDSEGVLMVECSTIADSDVVNESYCISINDGGTTGSGNRVELLWFSDGKFYTQVGNSGQEFISSDTFNNKILIKYGSGSYNLYVNGFRRITDTFTSISGLDTLDFQRHGSYTFKGKTKQIQYYNSVLADSELEELTSWVSFQEMANGQLYTIE